MKRAAMLQEIKADMDIPDMPDDLLESLINSMYGVIISSGLDFRPSSWEYAWQYLKDAGYITFKES